MSPAPEPGWASRTPVKLRARYQAAGNAPLPRPAAIQLISLEEDADRWCLWSPDHAGFDSRSIFESALVGEQTGIQKTL